MVAAGTDIDFIALQNAAMATARGENGAMLGGALRRDRVSVFSGLQGTRGIVADNRRRSAASDIIRDAHVERLLPDVVHVASPFDGFGDDTVMGAQKPGRHYLSVATVYDLIPFENPGLYLPTPLHLDWFGSRLDRLRSTDLILAISEHTRSRVIDLLGLPPERVVTIMGDTDGLFRPLDLSPDARTALLARYGIEKPFIMHTGILEPRKNVEGLVRAFARLSPDLRRSHQIVLAAKASEAQRLELEKVARQNQLDPSTLVFAGYVPDDDLAMLYNLCSVLAFPSFSEGLGLPPLEAMRCGSLAVGSSTTSTAEVIGDVDLLFDPHSVDSIAGVIQRVLGDAEFRAAKHESCQAQQKRFSWEGSAKLALGAIAEAQARRKADRARSPAPAAVDAGLGAGTIDESAVPRYRVGDGWPAPAVEEAVSRRPGLIVWDQDAAHSPAASRPVSREAAYRAHGYAGLIEPRELTPDLMWPDAPGVLGWLRQADAAQASSAMRRAASALEALDRAASLVRDDIGDNPLAVELANGLADTLRLPAQPRLFIDITELAKRDARSGVQRVTRNIVTGFLRGRSATLRIEPVYEENGNFRYARAFTARLLEQEPLELEDGVVDFQPGDIFLGLDLNILISDRALAMLERHRRRGLSVWFVVYDLLPLLMPECFDPGLRRPFHRWIDELARVADGLVAISRSVADEVMDYLDELYPARGDSLEVTHFNLGGDLDGRAPVTAPSEAETAALEALKGRVFFLKVGTLEPRKGHGELLDAFELLWADGVDVCLVLVGKGGWLTDNLIARVEGHPELGRRLFWLGAASDHVLELLYESAAAVIQASYGEGYGLPLVEAARHGAPIIARDIPVFRELAEGHATFFGGETARGLADAVRDWLALPTAERPASRALPWITWDRSMAELVAAIADTKPYRRWQPSETWRRTPTHPDFKTRTGVSGRGKVVADAAKGVLLDLDVTGVEEGAYQLRIVLDKDPASSAVLLASWLVGDHDAEQWTITVGQAGVADGGVELCRNVAVPAGSVRARLTIEHMRAGPVTLRAVSFEPLRGSAA